MAMRFAAGRSRVYLGSTLINRIYLGASLVYGIIASALNTAAFQADDVSAGTSVSECTFNVDGSATLTGNQSTSPASPRWWTDNSVPPVWMSYSSTGTGTITGGLVAGTRYQLNTPRVLGNSSAVLGVRNRVFTITFYDAATGGNTLGTKTFTANTEVP